MPCPEESDPHGTTLSHDPVHFLLQTHHHLQLPVPPKSLILVGGHHPAGSLLGLSAERSPRE